MAHVILYIACSLDGFIARRDGGIDWLSIVDREGEDYGYADFYASVDAVVMGRATYELTTSFEAWPYPGKKSVVFTRQRLRTVRDDVEFVSGDVAAVVSRLEGGGARRFWLVGGGELVTAFQRAHLIDEYIVSIIPILLGDGIPLFAPPGADAPLELLASRQYDSGLVQLHYRKPIVATGAARAGLGPS